MEIWKPIEGYENYMVSNMGRVKSIDHVINGKHIKGRFIGFRKHGNGYYRINLRKNGKLSSLYIHRLVAQAFIPNPQNKPCIDHISTNREDNRVENLRWVSHHENNQNPMSIAKYRQKGLERADITSKLKSKPVMQCDLSGKPLKKWKSLMEASKNTCINYRNISDACRGRSKTSGGYKWKFI